MAMNNKVVSMSYEFTRPADTTAYAVGDAISDSTTAPTVIKFADETFKEAFVTGQSIMIKKIRIAKSTTTVANSSMRLYLFSSGITVVNDNAAYPLLYAEKVYRIGYVDLSFVTEGTGSTCASSVVVDVNLTAKLKDATIYGMLVAEAAYAPGSAEKFWMRIDAIILD